MFNSFFISSVIAFIGILLLVGFILLKGERNSLNTIFLYFLISLSFWIFGDFYYFIFISQHIKPTYFTRLAHIGAVFTPTLFFHFTLHFTQMDNNKYIRLGIYLLSLLFLFLNISGSPLFIEKVEIIQLGEIIYYFGGYYNYFLIYLGLMLLSGIACVIYRFLKSSGIIHVQMKYFLFSTLAIFFAVAIYALSMLGLSEIRLDNLFLALYVSAIAYSITKSDLLDISVIITRLFSYILVTIVLFIISAGTNFLLSKNLLILILGNFLLILVFTKYANQIRLLIQTTAEQKFLKGKYDFKKALRVFQDHLNHSTSIEDIATNLHSDFRSEIEMGPVGLFLPQHYHVTYSISESFISYSPEYFDTIFDDKDELINTLKEKKDVISSDLDILKPHFKDTSVSAIIPFFEADALLGFIVLGPKFSEDRLTGEDVDFFRTISQQIPAVLDRISKTKTAAEVDVAKRIQLDILPEIPPYPGLDVAAFMEAADEVGGDYYDMLVKNDALWILMGDVTGHGLASGLVMFMAQSILTTVLQTRRGVTPAELNFLANNILCQNMGRLDEERPLTLASFCFTDKGRKVTLSGSHDNALIYRAGTRTIERLVLDDFPMGIGFTDVLGQEDFLEQQLEFQTGDIILMLSDGITEAVKAGDLEGETMGETPLEDILMQHHTESAEKIRNRVIDAVKLYTQNIFYDDVTLVVVRVVAG